MYGTSDERVGLGRVAVSERVGLGRVAVSESGLKKGGCVRESGF